MDGNTLMNIRKKPLKIATIGCCGYAGLLIDLLAELPDDCQLVAVTARPAEFETAQKFRKQGVAVYASADELFSHLSPEECPAVIIPTSIESHFDYTKKAIECGFHVLLEKPPVATIQDLDRLIDLQRQSGTFIPVNFQYLFSPMTQQLKTRLAGGEFGAVRTVRASALWTRPESYFSRNHWSGCLQVEGHWVLDGTIGNPLAHLLAEALYLATPNPGMAEPVSIQAELYHANEIESEDTSCLRIKTKDRAVIFYCASLCSKEMTPVLCEIETDRAVIRLIDFYRLEIIWRDGRLEKAETLDYDNYTDRRIMLKVLIDALIKNERPLITVEECRPYMLALNGAFESSGMPINISNTVEVQTTDQGPVRCIKGLSALITKAFGEQCLFSEIGAVWAKPGTPVELSGYDFFPSINTDLLEIDAPATLKTLPSSGCEKRSGREATVTV
jgi:predicted dehydrogenase